jgi:hypothetical protein
MEKEYTWHVYFINCDCAGHFEARLRIVPDTKYMRCQLCRKQVGPMQERDYGVVKAMSEAEAIKKAKDRRRSIY